ncbi:hypothetical protein SAMN04487781_3125 [Cellulosimicrobium cellulans]|nr:hypothetical protein SAMN04487781_3125 [Cellulosimicrobium cellulans]
MIQETTVPGAARGAAPTTDNSVLDLGEALGLPPGMTMMADKIDVNFSRKSTWDPNGRVTSTSERLTVSLRGGASIVPVPVPVPVPAPAPVPPPSAALSRSFVPRLTLIALSFLWRLLEGLARLDGGTSGLQRLGAALGQIAKAWIGE